MSSPFDDDRNRPRNRRDSWERQRERRTNPRRRNAIREEQDPYFEDEYENEYDQHYHDDDHQHRHHTTDYNHGHRNVDHHYYESDRENAIRRNVEIPERSRRLSSLMGFYERPEIPRREKERTPQTDHDQYDSERSGRFMNHVRLPPSIRPPPPPVDIPAEPRRSSFQYRQKEEHHDFQDEKDFQPAVEPKRDEFDDMEVDVESTEKDLLLPKEKKTEGKANGGAQRKTNGDDLIADIKLPSITEEHRSSTEIKKPPSSDKKFKTFNQTSTLNQTLKEDKEDDSSLSRKNGSDAKPPSLKEDRKTSLVKEEDRSSAEIKRPASLQQRLKTFYHQIPTSSTYHDLKEEDDESLLPKKNGSVLLPVLEDSEKLFHELVASGDVSAVSDFLNKHSDFNINCVNYQKISALHVAVHEQNEEMVKFLLSQPSLDVSDCVLHAVKLGNIKTVEMILDKVRETSPGLEDAIVAHSVDFPDDMTPLILAAQLGNYEIIDFLIKRDHTIPPVHHPYCKCETCKAELKKYDHLRYSTKKLDLYKAISNPMYIFHVTDDPILKAFELVKELQDAARAFPQFFGSYEELWKELRNFAVDLIKCCKNSQEVEIILKKPSGPVSAAVKYPRLQYAIDLKQKEFVSHAYTQAVLGDAWTGQLLEWKIRSPFMQFLSVFPRIPMLPFMAIMCIFLPNHGLVSKWKIPVNKMISSCASYLIFLLLLFLESNLDKKHQKRGPPHSGLEWVIILYVIGYIWDNIRLCFKMGTMRFFNYMWHWFDCIMLTLFVITFLSWLASWADVKANDEIDLPRKYWNSYDPLLIAEGFFAIAVVMAFFRLFRIVSLNYHLGPFMVSIGKMTLDLINFTVIFLILLLSWTAGFCRFYQPYQGMVQKDEETKTSVTQESSFVNFGMTLKTFFWAIFGMTPMEYIDVIIENLPGDKAGTTIINKHEFTELVGYFAFAVFIILSSVVILNMLIACMANTFTKVIDNIQVEWVFGRSQVYLSYMAASTLPSPFNLIPTASGIKTMLTWFRLLVKPKNGQKAKCNMTHCCFVENEIEPDINSEFPSLMSELAQRYLRMKEQAKVDTSNQEVIDFLKSELNEVKEISRRIEEAIMAKR